MLQHYPLFGLIVVPQMYPFASRHLCNFAETAPETWGETALKTAFYTEKSDIFSYAIILWVIFGHIGSDEVFVDPYHNFHPPGKRLPDWKLRTLILSVLCVPSLPAFHYIDVSQGTRPTLSERCPAAINQLITQCWDLQPSLRPSFTESMQQLILFYLDTCMYFR
jgi:hypothetical protein